MHNCALKSPLYLNHASPRRCDIIEYSSMVNTLVVENVSAGGGGGGGRLTERVFRQPLREVIFARALFRGAGVTIWTLRYTLHRGQHTVI